MIERTISTSFSTGTGLKKCSPSTRSGEEARVREQPVERSEELPLGGLGLDDRLDRGVRALQVGQLRGHGQTLEGGALLVVGQLARLDGACKRAPDGRARRVGATRVGLDHGDIDAGAHAHLGDP
jgi:hypothetical protein